MCLGSQAARQTTRAAADAAYPEHSKNLLSFIALALFFGTGSDNEGSDMTSVFSRGRWRASEQPAVTTDLSQPSGPGQVIIEPGTYLSISLQ